VSKLMDHGFYMQPKPGKSNDQAHPPIHPVKSLDKNSVTPEEWKVYDLIVRYFLGACSKDA